MNTPDAKPSFTVEQLRDLSITVAHWKTSPTNDRLTAALIQAASDAEAVERLTRERDDLALSNEGHRIAANSHATRALDYAVRATKAEATVAVLVEALTKARCTFDLYAGMHLGKNPPDTEKAKRNRDLADEIDALLTNLPALVQERIKASEPKLTREKLVHILASTNARLDAALTEKEINQFTDALIAAGVEVSDV